MSCAIKPGSRLLFKLSGEWLKGSSSQSLCMQRVEHMAQSLIALSHFRWAIMVGGGNFWRGRDVQHPAMTSMADNMGMMGTHMNAMALVSALKHGGAMAVLFTARSVDGVGETFSVWRAHEAWQKGYVVVLSGGLGHGCMSTDTAAVVRACELGCDILVKGTKVDGVYAQDPVTHPNALFMPRLTYTQALEQQLGFMDQTALLLARQYSLCMDVMSLQAPQALEQWSQGVLKCSRLTA